MVTQKRFPIIADFRAAQKNFCFRAKLLIVVGQLENGPDIPEVAGKTQQIRILFIDPSENLFWQLVNGKLCKGDVLTFV